MYYNKQQPDAEGLKSLTLKVSSKLPEVRVSNFINQKCLVFRPRPELVIKLRKFSDGTFKQKGLMTVVGTFIKIRKFLRHNFDSKYLKKRNHETMKKFRTKIKTYFSGQILSQKVKVINSIWKLGARCGPDSIFTTNAVLTGKIICFG